MVAETLLPLLQRVRLSQLVYLLFVLFLLLVAWMVLLDGIVNLEHAGGPAYGVEIHSRLGYEPRVTRLAVIACPHRERRPWPNVTMIFGVLRLVFVLATVVGVVIENAVCFVVIRAGSQF